MKKLFILFLLLMPFSISAIEVTSKSAILMDQDTGRILYSKNIDNKMLIASTTKIMTAVIAIESGKLEDKVIIGDEILEAYGSNIYLSLKEEISLIDLLYGLMLRSGNDASLAIANYVSNSTSEFVDLMNKKAQKLNMKNTTFCNPHGLDEKCQNISTARDMAILTKYANNLDIYKKIVGTKRYIAKSNLKTYDWYNKNKLLSTYPFTTGGKTGFTEKAKRTLVTTATKNNINLIVVTLNDPNDFVTHRQLYEYGFNNYKKYRILSKNKFKLENKYYKEIYIKNNIDYIFNKDEIGNIYIKYKLDKIDNPKNGDKVGNVEVYKNMTKIMDEEIYVKIKPKKSINIFKKILNLFKKN